MARRKSSFAIAAEYAALKGLLVMLQRLPFSWSRRVARGLVHGLCRLLPRKRHLVSQQLAACFPETSPEGIQRLAARSLDTLGDGVAAFAKMATMDSAEMDKWVVTEGFEHLDAALAQGRGVITFTGHFGCWEMMANYVTRHYPLVSMVVRPLDNPRLDGLVSSIRGSGGGGVIDSRRVLKDGLRLLRENGILGILIDQNFHKGGLFVRLFGRPAATSTLVPILARRTGCVVLPMHTVWRDGKVFIRCEGPVSLSRLENAQDAIAEDTQQLTSIVERWIRESPDQWLWLHNRWKRQPKPGEEGPRPLASEA